jgi:hypothetical protein
MHKLIKIYYFYKKYTNFIKNINMNKIISTFTCLIICFSQLISAQDDTSFFSDVEVYVADGASINFKGNLINNGSFTGEGEVVLNGTSAQIISGGGSFENLRVDNPTNVDFTDPADVFGVVYVDQGNLNSNDYLYLRCSFGTSGKTAQVGPVKGGGTISGDVTVEQCYPARRAFRFISPSVSTTTTDIRANWQEGAASYTDDPKNGYGTHITGVEPSRTNASIGQDKTNGFDYSPSGNASMFTFDNVNRGWNNISGTNIPLSAGIPYRIFIRGDRSIDITSNSQNLTNTKLRAKGNLTTGPVSQASLSQVAGSFNFIANPYHTQVDMKLLTQNSPNIMSNFYYVWDPTLGGTPIVGVPGGRGAYVTVDLVTGSTSFSDNTLNGTPLTLANEFLQPMQAAFVLVDVQGSASVDFKEEYKNVNATQTTVKSLSEYINIMLYDSESYNLENTPVDALRINLDGTFKITAEDDAPKIGNLDENLGRLIGNEIVSIEKRPFPLGSEELPLFINQYRRESYVMKFDVTANLTTQIFVKDNYLQTLTEITSSNNIFSFTLEFSIPESEASDRFSLVFESESLSTEDENLSNLSLYPNPTRGSFRISGTDLGQDAQVEIYSIIGQQVYAKKLRGQSSIEITDFNASSGVYLVKLKTNQGEKTFKLIKE